MAQWRKIHKVPPLMRQDEHNSDAYDPKVVSFGPYHHGKEELQLCQQAKALAVQMLVEGSGENTAFFYQKILDVIADARNCYVEGSTDKYTDDEFALMMLYDACFLIYCMRIDKGNVWYDQLIYECTSQFVHSLVSPDMFLLENQLPFPIVMLLINLRYGSEGEDAFNKFLHQSIWGLYQPNAAESIATDPSMRQPPLHLLEAFHRVLVWDPTTFESQSKVDIIKSDMKKHDKNFRSAKDLKCRGIYFKPSPSKSLKDVSFISGMCNGELQLPTCFVSRLSKVLFPNMIVYELCNNVGTIVVSYVNFMKLLIDSPGDVKELREKNILLISLGSDEEVLHFFNLLNTYEDASVYYFEPVKERVLQHYHSLERTWMTRMIHTLLSAPWTIVIGWLAGLLLFALTFLQTYYTILGYEPKNPKKSH